MNQLEDKSYASAWTPYGDNTIDGKSNLGVYDPTRVRTPNQIRKELEYD